MENENKEESFPPSRNIVFLFPSFPPLSSKEARAERRLQEGHEVQSTMIEVVCNDRLGKKVDVSFSGLVYARAA